MTNLNLTGGPTVFSDFTPSAFKYDSSSFYNWEQDNLPIWDLEDRTNFNYMKLGASLSSLSGMTFTLSSASVPSANVYSDIQDIINRLPKVVTCPIVVEIAKYGDLGELNLQGIEFEGSGGLLVRNLCYAHTGSYWDQVTTVTAAAALGQWPDGNTRQLVTQLSAPGWTDTLTNAETTNPNFSGVSVHSDSSLSANYRLFFERGKHFSSPVNVVVPDRLHMDIESSNFVRSGDTFTCSAYTNERDLSISSSDINIYWQNGFDTTRNLETDSTWFTPILATAHYGNGLIYGNYFSKVRIEQCGGSSQSVILSGICVDGGVEYVDLSSLEHATETGFQIGHSTCHLADCFAIRCAKEGYLILNSKVFVQGSLGAARIYNPTWNGSTLIHSGTGVGMYLRNSELEFPTSGNALVCDIHTLTRCDVGLEVYNSTVRGGNQTTEDNHYAPATADKSTITWTISQNLKDGVQVVGGILDADLIWMVYSNGKSGFQAESSQLRMTHYMVSHNFGRGFDLNNSEVEYGVNGCYPAYSADLEFEVTVYGPAGVKQLVSFYCSHNGLNMKLVGSSFLPYKDSSGLLPDSLGAMNNHTGSWSYGATASGVGCNMPYMILDNSYGEFVNFYGSTYAANGVNPGSIKGAICQCRNSSFAHFIGTKKSATTALGTANESAATPGFHGTAANLPYFQRISGFSAEANSKIEFSGPTKIFYFGVGCLAEDNSIIKFSPQIQAGQLVADKWELSAAANHTMVDLHSTRAGLVANNNSIIEMEYLGDGDYTPAGGGTDNFSEGLPYSTAAYVSGGYFQFYPNPYVEDHGGDDRFNLDSVKGNVNYRKNMYSNDQVSATYGGMCVRIIGDSEARVNHVNFPMGIDTTLLSGVYYDLSTTCWWPFIWNIADTSRFVAQNVSISGSFDGSHGYHGPSGTWPAGIPIDWYGASGPREIANNDAGVPPPKVEYDFENFGPFRLYFGIDPVYRNYVTTGSTDPGMVIHSICQGYLPSGLTLSAYPGDANAYKHNFSISGAGAFTITSGNITDLLVADGHHRVLMDETALNAWANAKHCTEIHVNMVGVIKGTTDPVGEGSEHEAGHGVGVRSIHTFSLGRKD